MKRELTTYSFFLLAFLSISETDSGMTLLSVSGSMRARRPADTEKIPKMMTGRAGLSAPWKGKKIV